MTPELEDSVLRQDPEQCQSKPDAQPEQQPQKRKITQEQEKALRDRRKLRKKAAKAARKNKGTSSQEFKIFEEDQNDENQVLFGTSRQSSKKGTSSTTVNGKTKENDLEGNIIRRQQQTLQLLERYDTFKANQKLSSMRELEEYHIPRAVERLKALGVRTPTKKAIYWPTCDACGLPIHDGRSHCDICQDGDWDICEACWQDGIRCLDPMPATHIMRKMTLESWAN